MKMILDWVFREAEWWEFWKPMSGVPGGAILGGLLMIVGYLLKWVL